MFRQQIARNSTEQHLQLCPSSMSASFRSYHPPLHNQHSRTKNLHFSKTSIVIIPAVCTLVLAIVTALLLSSSTKNKTTTSDAHDPFTNVTFLSGTTSIVNEKKLSFTNFNCQRFILTPNDFAAVHFPRMRYVAGVSNSQSCFYAPEYTIGIPRYASVPIFNFAFREGVTMKSGKHDFHKFWDTNRYSSEEKDITINDHPGFLGLGTRKRDGHLVNLAILVGQSTGSHAGIQYLFTFIDYPNPNAIIPQFIALVENLTPSI